jgi:hypothetical protein
MDTSERFLRFAAECELMAKVTRDRENKTVYGVASHNDGYGVLNWSSSRTHWPSLLIQ